MEYCQEVYVGCN